MPSTTYYYKAYVVVGGTEVSGNVASFQTSSDYLHDYGMPSISNLNPSLRTNGSNDRDDHWYSYSTNNTKRQIAVHTYTHPTSNEETANYVVLYDGNKYAPLWAAHTMNSTFWPDNNVGRTTPDPWANDPAISLTQQSGLDDANDVGFSRGHLVASNYRQTSKAQNKQTFYYSNQAPQWQQGFNDGVWNDLELAVAAHVPSGTTMLYVVTGVLYESSWYAEDPTNRPTTLPSGSLSVSIPSHFYKCLMKCTFNEFGIMSGAVGCAYVFSNTSHAGSYSSGITTIDSIEARAGFDFFANVPTDKQNTAEAQSSSIW